MIIPLNRRLETNVLALSLLTRSLVIDPQTPHYFNASGRLGNTPHLNGTSDPMLVRTVQHRLSNEAIISITVGVCVLFTSWWIYYLTRRAERGALSGTYLNAGSLC